VKFKIIAAVILTVLLALVYAVVSSNSGNKQPQPQQDQGYRIN
jgi:mannose/fructose/N-acetylgalactosamine-specific phosphotransferase system component IIC